MRKLVPALLACCATLAVAGAPFDYMAALRQAEGAVVSAGDDAAKRRSAHYLLANDQAFVGDTEGAFESFRLSSERPFRGSPADGVMDPQLRGALGAIVEAVRDRQIVIINEAHHVPRDRAFTTRLALELGKSGFQYLAVETLIDDIEAMRGRGYPVVSDGYYSRDPVFGDLLRRAMRAGYVPVAYEHAKFEENDPKKHLARREEGQARNIVERILKKDPKARILVHVGYGHVRKAVEEKIPIPKMMAAYLREMTGIDPYCIDQTQPWPADAALAQALFDAAPDDDFVVTPRGATRPYLASPAIDMFVFHKPAHSVKGRPHWLAMDGYRKPRRIPAKLLPRLGRRLIQAFVAGESEDAVPMDQVIVTAGETPPVLMLPKGKYRFAYQE